MDNLFSKKELSIKLVELMQIGDEDKIKDFLVANIKELSPDGQRELLIFLLQEGLLQKETALVDKLKEETEALGELSQKIRERAKEEEGEEV